MYQAITKVKPIENHKLILSFENEKRIFDLNPLLDWGRFSELKDINIFKKVHISFDTIEWDNGLDLDPEYLYEQSEKINSCN